jgi:hypothetical protein
LAELETTVIKTIHFQEFDPDGWPAPDELAPYFLAPKDNPWSPGVRGNDEWGMEVKGLYGTDAKPEIDQVNVNLMMTGTPDFGVFLHYGKWDGRVRQPQNFFSKGDLSRLREWVKTLHSNLLPIGLFIPYPAAWKAVEEFMRTDGALPTSIEWIEARNLPANTFPDPPSFDPATINLRIWREQDLQ